MIIAIVKNRNHDYSRQKIHDHKIRYIKISLRSAGCLWRRLRRPRARSLEPNACATANALSAVTPLHIDAPMQQQDGMPPPSQFQHYPGVGGDLDTLGGCATIPACQGHRPFSPPFRYMIAHDCYMIAI